MKKKVRTCWAIAATKCGMPLLLGFGYFSWEIPAHLSGYGTATFRIREQARIECQRLNATPHYKGKPHYKAVKVTVTMEYPNL